MKVKRGRMNRTKQLFAILLVIILTPAVAMAGIADGLVLFMPLDGDTLDHSVFAHNAVVSGAISSGDRFNVPDGSLQFDGVDDFIEISSPGDELNIGDQSWAISVWVKPEPGVDVQSIVGRYECGWNCAGETASAFYVVEISAEGLPSFAIRDDNNISVSAVHPDTIVDGQWHQIVGVLDRSTAEVKIFVDGSLSNSESAAALGTVTDGGSPFEIGRHFIQSWGSPKWYTKGAIDDLRVYNRALLSSEIAQLYDLGDADHDFIPDGSDNCPEAFNPDQLDTDELTDTFNIRNTAVWNYNQYQSVFDTNGAERRS